MPKCKEKLIIINMYHAGVVTFCFAQTSIKLIISNF